MHLNRCSRQLNQPAFSLIELLVAMGVSSILVGAIMSLTLFCNRSFVALGNYMDLNNTSLNALDTMTRDIRGAYSLKSFATNQLVFLDASSNALTFAWSPGAGTLTRSYGGAVSTLLDNCDYLAFDISQRTPMTNGTMGFYTASNNPVLCKLVSVSWRCSRSILGQKANTESVQTAKIMMRN